MGRGEEVRQDTIKDKKETRGQQTRREEEMGGSGT